MEAIEKEILFSREDIDERVRALAETISRDYAGKEVVLVGILKGAVIFMADLMRSLRIPCTIDFVRLASYGSGTSSSGKINITKDIETSIQGKDILIVEDIVDTGLTIDFLAKWLMQKGPKSMKVCTFLDKPLKRKIPFEADYVGFAIDDGFVVGYGLDYDERFRYLPDVHVIKALT